MVALTNAVSYRVMVLCAWCELDVTLEEGAGSHSRKQQRVLRRRITKVFATCNVDLVGLNLKRKCITTEDALQTKSKNAPTLSKWRENSGV